MNLPTPFARQLAPVNSFWDNSNVVLTFYRGYYFAVALLLSCFVLYDALEPSAPLQARAFFVLMLCSISVFAAVKSSRPTLKIFLIQQIIIVASILSFGYIILNAEAIEWRIGITTTADKVFGVTAIAIVMVMTQRLFGWTLPIIAAVFLLYARFGAYVPEVMGGGLSNYNLDRIITFVYLSMNGFFGTVIAVMVKFVFLFIMFGVVLESTGALGFLMDLSRSLLGRVRGGPAFVAVLASGFMGSVSGSAVANVTVTGTMTIPLMKNIGFKPEAAGGVEAAASTGGQFMPPIMGATAFLITEFIGVSYLEVISAALIPAILYFLGVMTAVFMYVRRENIGVTAEGMPEDNPRFIDVIRQPEGIVTIGGVGLLITLLVMKFSPTYSAMYGMLAMIVMSWATKTHRITPLRFVKILGDAAIANATLGMAAACVGIIVGALLLTGLSVRMSGLILDVTGGSLLALLMGVTLASLILGMGLPTSITYIILAVTLAPAVVKAGVEPMAAHLFIFYMGMMAMVTPPVAFAAYAAATIAGTGFMKTGFQALRMALPAYFLAFAFVFRNELLMMGSTQDIAITLALTFAVMLLVGLATNGKWTGRGANVERGALLLGCFLLILNSGDGLFDPTANLIGLILVAFALTRKGVTTISSGLRRRGGTA